MPNPQPPSDELMPVADRLAQLRQQGAGQLDPVRFHYLEVVAQRLAAARAEVQPVLERRLGDALSAYEQRWRARAAAAGAGAGSGGSGGSGPGGAPKGAHPSLAPLVQLNQYIRQGAHPAAGTAGTVAAPGHALPREPRSVQRFRKAWSRMAAEDQVANAVRRGPQNAGPLNSHRLVLQSLALMRTLSPGYLQHFLSQVDTLLWLDQVAPKLLAADAKSPRKPRPKK